MLKRYALQKKDEYYLERLHDRLNLNVLIYTITLSK